ncbi:MAG TPA: hypothetical protein DHD79_00495 [Firmicutes bacterium]|nr:hypothetical protein [Bacillota bacterium]HAW69900.1 hypothetical protein [Bacillota bacterium]HAZ22687.1 hypothetical protein [Bacillota bacterium]HBE05573.1 hypothetical protein [Bacillota bacterium]HBG42898.1 hypothetical protein [Bacillota bacterium]
MRKAIFALILAAVLMLLVAIPAAAAPSLVEASGKVGYYSLDETVTYGFEVEVLGNFYFQYLTNPATQYFTFGSRYVIIPQESYTLSLSIAQSLRLHNTEPSDFLSSFCLAFDYDPNWITIGIEAGGGLSMHTYRFFYMVQIKFGLQYIPR